MLRTKIHTVSSDASETEPLRFGIAYTVKQREPATVLGDRQTVSATATNLVASVPGVNLTENALAADVGTS